MKVKKEKEAVFANGGVGLKGELKNDMEIPNFHQFKNYTISSITDDNTNTGTNSNYPTPNQTPTPLTNVPVGRRSSDGHLDPNGIPFLSRDFVVRRISEGETGRLKEELKCEACGKGYRHITSLAKHLWEHTPEWQKTKKFSISKHQQVQLLEAASILCGLNDLTHSKVVIRRQKQESTKASKTSLNSRKSFSLSSNELLSNRKMSGSWKPPTHRDSRRGSLIDAHHHSDVIYDDEEEDDDNENNDNSNNNGSSDN